VNRSRRPTWSAYFCALLAFAFCVSGSVGAFAMLGAVWTAPSASNDAVLLANVDPAAEDSRDDEDGSSSTLLAVPAMVEEEQREDDPVPEADYELVELSEVMGRLVVWDRPDFARPVKDPVVETSCPPPRRA